MSVYIYKKVTTYPKSTRVAVEKITQVRTCENYREAILEVEKLNARNKKENITFFTSNIHR